MRCTRAYTCTKHACRGYISPAKKRISEFRINHVPPLVCIIIIIILYVYVYTVYKRYNGPLFDDDDDRIGPDRRELSPANELRHCCYTCCCPSSGTVITAQCPRGPRTIAIGPMYEKVFKKTVHRSVTNRRHCTLSFLNGACRRLDANRGSRCGMASEQTGADSGNIHAIRFFDGIDLSYVVTTRSKSKVLYKE